MFYGENTQNLKTTLAGSLDFQTSFDECYDLNSPMNGLKSILCRNSDSFVSLNKDVNGFIEEIPSACEKLNDRDCGGHVSV